MDMERNARCVLDRYFLKSGVEICSPVVVGIGVLFTGCGAGFLVVIGCRRFSEIWSWGSGLELCSPVVIGCGLDAV